MTYPVKWAHSLMRGAPVLNRQPGSIINIFQKFLIDGFGEVTSNEIVVTDGIARATLPSNSLFLVYSVIKVSGAVVDDFNGEHRVTQSASDWVEWETDVPDGTYTETTDIRYAPVGGWSKPFHVGNVAVFKSTDPQAHGGGYYLRIDDSMAATTNCYARVVAYEQMTDVNTGINPFPTSAQQPDGYYWNRSLFTNNDNPRKWVYVADSRCIVGGTCGREDDNDKNLPLVGFGDAIALRPTGDPFSTFLSGHSGTTGNNQYRNDLASINTSSTHSISLPRPLAGLGNSEPTYCRPFSFSANDNSGNSTYLGSFPDSVSGRLWMCRKFFPLGGGATGEPRAIVPGVCHISSRLVGETTFPLGSSPVDGDGEFLGKKLLIIPWALGPASSASDKGAYAIDITGPWR